MKATLQTMLSQLKEEEDEEDEEKFSDGEEEQVEDEALQEEHYFSDSWEIWTDSWIIFILCQVSLVCVFYVDVACESLLSILLCCTEL